MNRVREYFHKGKYKEPIFRRIVLVVLAFAVILTFASTTI